MDDSHKHGPGSMGGMAGREGCTSATTCWPRSADRSFDKAQQAAVPSGRVQPRKHARPASGREDAWERGLDCSPTGSPVGQACPPARPNRPRSDRGRRYDAIASAVRSHTAGDADDADLTVVQRVLAARLAGRVFVCAGSCPDRDE